MNLQSIRRRNPRSGGGWRPQGADAWDTYQRPPRRLSKEEWLDIGVWVLLVLGLVAAAGLVLFSLYMSGLISLGRSRRVVDAYGRELLCPQDGEWYAVGADMTAELPCRGSSGLMRARRCTELGEWLPEPIGQCGECPGGLDDHPVEPRFWAATPAGQTQYQECPSERRAGSWTRACSYDGVWHPPQDACYAPPCPADGVFLETSPGGTFRLRCPPGYGGEHFRTCDWTGSWEDPVNTCISLR